MTLIVRSPRDRAAERKYILDVILADWLGLSYHLVAEDRRGTVIQLAGDPQAYELALTDLFLATSPGDWLTERSMPKPPLVRLTMQPFWPVQVAPRAAQAHTLPAEPIPVLFCDPGANGSVWRRTPTGLTTPADLLGSAFFLLTRYEEVVRTIRDRHDRFPASASLAAEDAFLERPVVDEYVDHLWMALHYLWPSLVRRPTTFRLRPTHDVDSLFAVFGQSALTVARALVGDVLRRRDPGLAARRVRSIFDAVSGRVDRDPFNTFDLLMDASERHGLQAVFYFMAGNSPGDFDFRYQIFDGPVVALLRRIHERGHEVGLHASYLSHRSEERTIVEFGALKEACRMAGFEQSTWGVRQHYLRFATPETWRIHEAAGFEHDSTLGFADNVGFRAGTCREFPVFDLVESRRLRLRERPLLMMDKTMLQDLALDPDQAVARARLIGETCRRHRGDAVMLYHNSSLPGARMRAHYDHLVDELAEAINADAPG